MRQGTAYEQILLRVNPLSEKADELTTITGNGMVPLYQDGDKVFVQYCDKIAIGEVGVFQFPDTELVIRYEGKNGLHRINPECENTVLDERNGMVIGRVLGKLTADMIPSGKEERQWRSENVL